MRPAPLEQIDRAEVPRQVDDHVAGPHVAAQHLAEVARSDPLGREARTAFLDPACVVDHVGEVDDRVLRRRRLHVLEQQRQGAARDCAQSDHEDPAVECTNGGHVSAATAGRPHAV